MKRAKKVGLLVVSGFGVLLGVTLGIVQQSARN
jgi:hypothetical protein